MPHTWTYEDDILIFYLYRYEEDNLISLETVSKFLSFNDEGSVKMRIKNFQACDGQGGLQNYAQLTKKVYSECFNLSQGAHRQKCLEILQIA